MPTFTLLLAILAPLLVGALSLLMPRRWRGARVAMTAAGPVAAMAGIGLVLHRQGVGASLEPITWLPGFHLDVALALDPLGVFFALLVAAIGLLIILYARAYFGPDEASLYRFYPSLLLFMTAMLGVALSDSLMLLLLFWEMTSISSFLLIGWNRETPGAVRNAMQAFIVTGAGGLAMMGGLILLGVSTGLWTFSGLLAQPQALAAADPALITAAFILVFAGAAAKSAQWPLHFWLPGAMAAPTPVSAYLHSATMVKAGVFLVGRFWPILAAGVGLWPKLIIPIGAITMVYGAALALRQQDLKKIFAYTTVSQLGLFMCMYGLAAYAYVRAGSHALQETGTRLAAAGGRTTTDAVTTEPNLIWDVTQILNHAVYKAPLFILAGAIGHVASRRLDELRGFFFRDRTARIMSLVLLLAAYGLAAGPGTLSFVAKEFFFYQVWHGLEITRSPWMGLLVVAAIATGMFNVAIFVRLAATLLARPGAGDESPADHAPDHEAHAHESGFWPAFLWIPGAVIVAVQFLGGLAPGVLESLLGPLEGNKQYFDHLPGFWNALAHPSWPLAMSGAAIVLGVILGLSPFWRGVLEDPHDRLYPGFYQAVTRGGGWLFRRVQTGHTTTYIAATLAAAVGLLAFSLHFDPGRLTWPGAADLPEFSEGEALAGILLTLLGCTAAILMPMTRDRISRVLVLGGVGFVVTSLFYLYRAPDLALTQLSIEIVSLVLFLLVLSLLPDPPPRPGRPPVFRLLFAVAVGAAMFGLTYTSISTERPAMPYRDATGAPIPSLGAFFLRNAHTGRDTAAVAPGQIHGGVVARPPSDPDGHAPGHGGKPREEAAHEPAGTAPAPDRVGLHPGGGGHNVVNVILVDFRGLDTMGEIAVLALAALGVWTLLHRRRDGAEDPGEADP